jgi:hypothetical protein
MRVEPALRRRQLLWGLRRAFPSAPSCLAGWPLPWPLRGPPSSLPVVLLLLWVVLLLLLLVVVVVVVLLLLVGLVWVSVVAALSLAGQIHHLPPCNCCACPSCACPSCACPGQGQLGTCCYLRLLPLRRQLLLAVSRLGGPSCCLRLRLRLLLPPLQLHVILSGLGSQSCLGRWLLVAGRRR